VYAGIVQEVSARREAPPSGDAAGRLPARPGAPRRERKKRQTRDALIDAALELFDAKGYENAAVREITDAVDVSERTFFRYFVSKEDLALSFVRDGADALLEALTARPAGEEPLTALRRAFRASLCQITADRGILGRKPSYLSVLKLIESTPTLLAASLRYVHDHDEAMVRVLARREGVDPAADPRPRIIATLFAGLVSLTLRDWLDEGAKGAGEAGGDTEAMLAAFDAYADQLGPALFGHWNTGNH
jgi:AcrR family transcriptional regulator